MHCNRILKALSEYIYHELTSIGVRIVQPKGGFYMMPDFEVLYLLLHMGTTRLNIINRKFYAAKHSKQRLLPFKTNYLDSLR